MQLFQRARRDLTTRIHRRHPAVQFSPITGVVNQVEMSDERRQFKPLINAHFNNRLLNFSQAHDPKLHGSIIKRKGKSVHQADRAEGIPRAKLWIPEVRIRRPVLSSVFCPLSSVFCSVKSSAHDVRGAQRFFDGVADGFGDEGVAGEVGPRCELDARTGVGRWEFGVGLLTIS